MEKVKKVADWITKWFTLIVIVWAVFNYFVPQTSKWAKHDTSWLLGIVLFGMGLTLSLEDFARILKQPLMVIVGTVAHYVIMPLIAVALCAIFHLDGPLAVGVILVGCCPSGTSSNVMSFLARGDVALDVSIGLLSTLLAPFMIPLLMQLLASKYVAIPWQSLFLTAVKVVLIPVALGVICHTIFKDKIAKVTDVLPIISQTAILLIIGIVVAANHAGLFSTATALAIPVVILHNLCGYGLGFGFSRLMYKIYPRGFGYAQQKAITFEVGMQDSGLGATLALTSFAAAPITAIPSTFFSVWHNISGSVLSSWWRRHDEKKGLVAADDSEANEVASAPKTADISTKDAKKD
ncbi:bile acid:sodium symporter family protein [Bifidobacterium sp. ESL0732]|uniref:bile acid:sodium symporter family protein n=1 Tax=Bifidobacterium sp. ESL0732 TaxID=2983222 RepID=UPI0023F6FECC|nr:bile acid:sodium symporter family protein [Bifidobacterium sp. ESL0732]WEV63696.1 bile acid:sodium symporter family protein [Bifidobacterium sp. ESL0732]